MLYIPEQVFRKCSAVRITRLAALCPTKVRAFK